MLSKFLCGKCCASYNFVYPISYYCVVYSSWIFKYMYYPYKYAYILKAYGLIWYISLSLFHYYMYHDFMCTWMSVPIPPGMAIYLDDQIYCIIIHIFD